MRPRKRRKRFRSRNRAAPPVRWIFSFCLWAAAATTALGSPTAEEIIERLLRSSEDATTEANRNAFGYLRGARTEYLDGRGKVHKEVSRTYRVWPVDGEPVTTLVLKNGRPVREGEDDEYNRSAARENGEKGRTLSLSRELLDRYQFTLAPATNVGVRPAFVLNFTPKPDAEADGVFERLLNAMGGTLYIDKEDYQLAQAEIHLLRRVRFFGGIAGALDRLRMSFSQKRIEPGVWLPHSTFIDFDGRKVLSDVRFRYYETCSAHRRAGTGLPSGPQESAAN